jgi:Rieske Fe-S protein
MRLERWARARFPMAGELLHRWSGQVVNSFDGLALIGRDIVERNVYVITGDTGMGMTHGTLGGKLIADLLVGRPNPWAELYDPARIPASTLGTLLQEGLNVAGQYKELLTGSEVKHEEDIRPGSGAIMGWGPHKVAVYRDAQGLAHTRSAVCPHLGCIVGWNDAEKSWDCPCHGSRFDPYGQVVNGPATSDLGPADAE